MRAIRHPADLLAMEDPSRPLVTFYDDATGERVELSGRTFGNWVAKTANLLVDDLGAQPGDRVALALPPHWQTGVWLFACWSAGLVVAPVGEEGDPGAAEIMAMSESAMQYERRPPATGHTVSHTTSRGPLPSADIVGLSLHALGAPLAACPPGVIDYAVEVRGHGDHFTPQYPLDPDAPALTVTNGTLSGAELVTAALEAAAAWRLSAASRVLTTVGFTTLDSLLAGLLASIAAGGSVIICRNLDEAELDRRMSMENVTAVAGVTEPVASSASMHRLM